MFRARRLALPSSPTHELLHTLTSEPATHLVVFANPERAHLYATALAGVAGQVVDIFAHAIPSRLDLQNVYFHFSLRRLLDTALGFSNVHLVIVCDPASNEPKAFGNIVPVGVTLVLVKP